MDYHNEKVGSLPTEKVAHPTQGTFERTYTFEVRKAVTYRGYVKFSCCYLGVVSFLTLVIFLVEGGWEGEWCFLLVNYRQESQIK